MIKKFSIILSVLLLAFLIGYGLINQKKLLYYVAVSDSLSVKQPTNVYLENKIVGKIACFKEIGKNKTLLLLSINNENDKIYQNSKLIFEEIDVWGNYKIEIIKSNNLEYHNWGDTLTNIEYINKLNLEYIGSYDDVKKKIRNGDSTVKNIDSSIFQLMDSINKYRKN